MINKKAQGEIITTVLIILLVLAAIVIVWQVVNSTVSRAGEQADAASQCVGIMLSFKGQITNSTPTLAKFTLERGNDVVGVDSFKTILTKSDGTTNINVTTSLAGLKAYESKEYTVTLPTALTPGSSYIVQIAPKIGTTSCDPLISGSFIP